MSTNTSGVSIQSAFSEGIMSVLSSLSFYSPIITIVSVFVFSIFTGSTVKAWWYFLWLFVITFIRIIVFKSTGAKDNPNMNPECLKGLTQIFVPQDVTYSTYLLSFTLMYFILPMFMVSQQNKVNVINYSVLGFFIAYIILDLFIKSSYRCIPTFFSQLVIGSLVSGLFLGGIVAGVVMYGSSLRSYLFINEANTTKEVCSMPTKQQFKCSVYKNGELVGSTIN